MHERVGRMCMGDGDSVDARAAGGAGLAGATTTFIILRQSLAGLLAQRLWLPLHCALL